MLSGKTTKGCDPMKKTQKLAEKLFFSCLLTMSSGGQTAYSYLNHKGVFAGFQSGNLIRMAVNLGQGHFADLPPYFVSIIFFMIGTVLTRILHFHYDDPSHEIRLNALVLIISFLAMAVVAWISQTGHHLLATAFLTISTAAQFEEFRSLEGTNYTPTMMSGNFKRLTENLFDYFLYPNATVKASAKSNIFYFIAIILSYFTGVLAISLGQNWLGIWTIFIPMTLTALGIGILFLQAYTNHSQA